MKRRITLLAAWLLAVVLLQGADFSPEQAKRIDDFLTRIARLKRSSLFLKKATFSQKELNSYLNLIYVKKYAPEVTAIDLKLENDDQLNGSAKVVLKGKSYEAVPSFLRDIDLRFSGRIESSKFRMRFLFDELIINGTRFAPELLDEAFGAAQGGAKVKKSLFDWFALLPGLKGIHCSAEQITFQY